MGRGAWVGAEAPPKVGEPPVPLFTGELGPRLIVGVVPTGELGPVRLPAAGPSSSATPRRSYVFRRDGLFVTLVYPAVAGRFVSCVPTCIDSNENKADDITVLRLFVQERLAGVFDGRRHDRWHHISVVFPLFSFRKIDECPKQKAVGTVLFVVGICLVYWTKSGG